MKEKLNNLYLHSATARRLYDEYARDLPIIDYHCHLSPQEICENKRFDNIGDIWLGGDHYKWRLMRTYGIDEYYITGDAPMLEKFKKYAEVLAISIGGPLYYWSHMELATYFGIYEPLTPESAERIWHRANAAIVERNITPRALIEQSKVEYIGTTDDPCDDLHFHEQIEADSTFTCRVEPSFRADPFVLITNKNFRPYIAKLRDTVGFDIKSISDFERAISLRLDFFKAHNARFADIGIEFFPKSIGTREQAEEVLLKAIAGDALTDEEYNAYLGYIYCFIGGECKKRDIVLQLHLAVKRNPNSKLFRSFGPDAGADCIGEQIEYWDIITLLDTMQEKESLPQTILYALNPSMIFALATIAGAYQGVRVGAAWWFCDHQRGIEDHVKMFAETGHLSPFYGMLTDSRSFLSYARHDYFRRIMCSVFAEWIDRGEVFDEASCIKLLESICYYNSRNLVIR